jgi:multidrug resistance efflux pump
VNKSRRRLRSALRYANRSLFPLGLWLLAIAAVFWLLPSRGTRLPVPGVVETQRYDVVATLDGRLTAMLVERHDRVESGQIIARLSDDDLRLRLTRARYELEQLRADLQRREAELTLEAKATSVRHELDTTTEARRRTSDVEAAHLDELETRAEVEEAKIRLQGVTIEVDRLRALEQQAIASDAALVRLRTERDALSRRIQELEGVLQQQHARVLAARERLSAFTVTVSEAIPRETLLEPMRWRLKMQEAELERIALLSRNLDVAAPSGGFVESIKLRSGQWVASGDTLITIVDPTARRILAYLPETARSRVAVQSTVQMMRDAVPGAVRSTLVVSLSPALVRVPQRLWRDPRIEEWAIEAVLAPHGDEAPGERVSLLLPP